MMPVHSWKETIRSSALLPISEPLLRESIRRFAASELNAAETDERRSIGPRLISALAELGAFGLTLPESHGGYGLSLGDACAVVAELAVHDRSVATTVGLHLGLGTRGLVEFGNEELKATWLPRLASGEVIAAFAATEPEAGSDLRSVQTTLEQNGDELRLSGEKCFVTNGGFAGVFTVLARSPGIGGRRAHCLVLVPRDAPGVEIGPEEHKLGLKGSSTVTVRFDGTPIPWNQVLGEPGQGLAHAQRVLEWGRTLMSAGCVGTAQAALAASLDHVSSRRQFGRTLSRFPAVRHSLVDMAACFLGMQAIVREVAEAEARGDSIDTISAMAKVHCSEGAFFVCDTALQLHGAMGYVEDAGIARMLRDCRVTRIFEGANDVLAIHLGTALLGGRLEIADTGNSSEPVPVVLGQVHAALGRVVGHISERWGVAVIRRQWLLTHLGRAWTAVRVAGALHRISGADDALGARGVTLACREASARLTALAVADSEADPVEALAADLLDDRDAGPAPRSKATVPAVTEIMS